MPKTETTLLGFFWITRLRPIVSFELKISIYDDLSAFKIYLVDVGLLRRVAQLAPTAFGEGNRLFTEFKGALTENYVLQTLLTQFEVLPRYWTQSNPPYEVDFLIQRENDVFHYYKRVEPV